MVNYSGNMPDFNMGGRIGMEQEELESPPGLERQILGRPPVAGTAKPVIRPPGQTGSRYYPSDKTTIFVGNLPSRLEDAWIKNLLEECGHITRWTRATDPLTLRKANYGFADIATPRGAFLAVRTMHGALLGRKPLIVRSQCKANEAIERWKSATLGHMQSQDFSKSMDAIKNDFDREMDAIRQRIVDIIDEKHQKIIDMLTPEDESNVNAPDGAAQTTALKSRPRVQAPKQGQLEGRGQTTPKMASETTPREGDDGSTPSGQSKYLSKGYKPSRREIDRIRRFKERMQAMERELIPIYLEYESDEEARINRKTPRPSPDPDPISEDMRANLIEMDLSDRVKSSDDRKKRHERRKRLAKEAEEDRLDRIDEEKEIEAAKESMKQVVLTTSIPEPTIEAEVKTPDEIPQPFQESIAPSPHSTQPYSDDYHETPHEMPIFQQSKKKFELKMEVPKTDDAVDTSGNPKLSYFNTEEEDVGGLFTRKHKPLTRIDDIGEHKSIAATEARKKAIEESMPIVALIPSEMNDIFAYPMDWDLLERVDVIKKKLIPWIKGKVIDLMGDAEDIVTGVVDFVLEAIKKRTPPGELLAQVEVFLDEEAQRFVKNMWRMLIYEQLWHQMNKK